MSQILEAWRAGEGLPGVLAIDAHTHVHDWPHGATFGSLEDAALGVVAAMDANGVDASCVQGGGQFVPGADYTRGNDHLLRLTEMIPDRLIPFAHVNPNDRPERILAELKRVYAAGVRCLKLINSYQQQYPGDGPNMMEVYRFAADRNMLVFNHAWGLDEMRRIAPQFPSTDFMFGHYGPHQDEVLKELPNVYANIWNLCDLGFIERGIRNAGPEKFTFGSDAFMNSMSVGIGLVVYADVPDEHKRMVLGANMARLLEKVGALPEGLRHEQGG